MPKSPRNRQCELPLPPCSRLADLRPETLAADEQAHLIDLALELVARRQVRGAVLGNPAHTRAHLRLRLGERRHEVFGCIFLDNRHRILADEELFQGTIDGASVYPRVVVTRALELNAAAVVFYHNHPSGVAEPSRADELLTRRLREALALVEIRVLDHFVVTFEDAVSFAERGLL